MHRSISMQGRIHQTSWELTTNGWEKTVTKFLCRRYSMFDTVCNWKQISDQIKIFKFNMP